MSIVLAQPRISRRRQPRGLLRFVVLAALVAAGCNSVAIRDTIPDRLARETRERLAARPKVPQLRATVAHLHPVTGPKPSEQSPASRPDYPLERLEEAEDAYREAIRQELFDRDGSIDGYRNAAGLASEALETVEGPALTRAIEIHNLAVGRMVRHSQSVLVRRGRHWRKVLEDHGVTVLGDDGLLEPEILDQIRVADDLKVVGMHNVYRSDGLGVPLVAQRVVDPNEPLTSQDFFYPKQLQAAATAVILPTHGDPSCPRTLALIDPFDSNHILAGSKTIPLASDTTTPLAMQVADGALPLLELTGLLRADFRRENVAAGLYMLRPYEPGKIPVVFVHGLFSSPRAFLQAINELNNDPEIAARFQPWVFLYPTGQPVPISAARLRESLLKVRGDLDPSSTDVALDQMVLVGHSMGGLLSKCMALKTEWKLWDATIRRNYDQLVAPGELREDLKELLVFEPLPFVKRLVFIATPHRGSEFANQFIGRLTINLIRLPDGQEKAIQLLKQLNGPNIISGELKWQSLTSVGNLKPNSPILTTLDQIPIASGVPYHSIIPAIGGQTGQTDGIVPYTSSHLDGVTSELVVTGTHSSQQKPEVVQEIRRILFEHIGATPATIDPAGRTIATRSTQD